MIEGALRLEEAVKTEGELKPPRKQAPKPPTRRPPTKTAPQTSPAEAAALSRVAAALTRLQREVQRAEFAAFAAVSGLLVWGRAAWLPGERG
jgi:hypothetical protein